MNYVYESDRALDVERARNIERNRLAAIERGKKIDILLKMADGIKSDDLKNYSLSLNVDYQI